MQGFYVWSCNPWCRSSRPIDSSGPTAPEDVNAQFVLSQHAKHWPLVALEDLSKFWRSAVSLREVGLRGFAGGVDCGLFDYLVGWILSFFLVSPSRVAFLRVLSHRLAVAADLGRS